MIQYTKEDLQKLVDSMDDKDTIYAGIFSIEDVQDQPPALELESTELRKIFDYAICHDYVVQHLFGEVVQEFGFLVSNGLKHFGLDDGWEYQGLIGREKVA